MNKEGGLSTNEVLFEMSHPVRVSLMKSLLNGGMNLTEMAKTVEVTTAEVSRHLSRLTNARLIERNSDNKYYMTDYGCLLMLGYESMDKIVTQRDFFENHPLHDIDNNSQIISITSKCRLCNGTLNNTSLLLSESRKANNFIYMMSNNIFSALVPTILEKANKGSKVMQIFPTDLEEVDVIASCKKIYVKKKDTIPLELLITENIACMCFRNRDGVIDYNDMFVAEELGLIEECRCLFHYYWENLP